MSSIKKYGGLADELWLEVLKHMPDYNTFVSFSCTSKHMHGLPVDDIEFARSAIVRQFDPRILKLAFVVVRVQDPANPVRSWLQMPDSAQSQQTPVVWSPIDLKEIRQLATLDAIVDSLVPSYVEWAQNNVPKVHRDSEWSKAEVLRVKSAMYRLQMMCRLACSPSIGPMPFRYMKRSEPCEHEQMLSIREFLRDLCKHKCRDDRRADFDGVIMRGLAYVYRLVHSEEPIETSSMLTRALKKQPATNSWNEAWYVGKSGSGYAKPSRIFHPETDAGPNQAWEWSHPRRTSGFTRRMRAYVERMDVTSLCRNWGCYFWDKSHVDVLIPRVDLAEDQIVEREAKSGC